VRTIEVLRSALSARLEILECQPQIESPRPPVLFVHGAYAAAWTWAEHFMPHFAARGHSAYALSLRGHGASAGRDALEWASLADYVEDLGEAIDALDTPPVLVGHSMGAMVIMKHLERESAPAAALVAPVPPHGLFPSSFMLALGRPGLFGELNGLMARGTASVGAMQSALFAGPLPAEQLLDYYGRFQRESQRAIWDMTLFNLPLAWRMNRPPMIALLAARDALFPVEASRAGFAAIGVRAEVLDDVGHAVMLDRGWQRAADRIVGWLEEQLPR
jgi:non-heme chloroperoxidase